MSAHNSGIATQHTSDMPKQKFLGQLTSFLNTRGDVALVRDALDYAGMDSDVTIFNDRLKTGKRKIKIAQTTWMLQADEDSKAKFMDRLRANFGNRVVKYFLQPKAEWHQPYDRSFVRYDFVIYLTL